MAESRLAEQIRRIREMSKRMSWIEEKTAELSSEMKKRDNVRRGAIEGVRDVRPYSRPGKARRRRR
jgi:hypothetical protein